MEYTWQYYDLVLLGVFASITLGAGVGMFTPVPLVASVVAFSVVAVAFIGHGLFVNGPVDDPGDLTDAVESLN